MGKKATTATLDEAMKLVGGGDSRREVESMVRSALQTKLGQGPDGEYAWIQGWYGDDTCVYQFTGTTYKITYNIDTTGTDPVVNFGEPQRVEQVYVVAEGIVSEAADIIEAPIQLLEASVRRDGTIPVKVIQPGWGSSGFYPAATLARDVKVFEGSKMFWDHPTVEADKQRPERSLNDLAGVLSNVHYMKEHAKGPGIYGDAKVFGPYQERVSELAPHIGLSILAGGKARPGEAEGKNGLIIEAITASRSVDFVTTAGAGGEILNLFESARISDGDDTNEEVKESMDLKEALAKIEADATALTEAQTALSSKDTKLTEARTELARFKEAEVIGAAKAQIAEGLKEAQLPDMTKARIAEALSINPPTKDGALDKDALTIAVTESIKVETAYIAALTESGKIKGLGGSDDTTDPAKVTESLTESFTALGLSESAAKSAATGRS